MLGVRIDPTTEAQLTALARARRQSKSDIAREAIAQYLATHDLDQEARRQSLLASATDKPDDYLRVDESGWQP